MKGIHDFLELQGCVETMQAAKAATSRFCCDYCRLGSADVRRTEGEAPPASPAKEKKDYDNMVAGFRCTCKMAVRATVLFSLSGPNPIALVPSPFPMLRLGYSR